MLKRRLVFSVPLIRSFHRSANSQAFVRRNADTTGEGSVFKRGSPKKDRGWIYDFKFIAAHSKFSKNAPDASGVEILHTKNLKPQTIVQYPSKIRNSLSIFGSFKRDQQHELFKERITMIRESSSFPMFNIIEKGLTIPSSENRYCILGDRGVGKTSLLAQAQAFALLQGYIVLAIPRASELVSGENDTAYSEKLKVHSQPMYIRKWMNRFAKGNFKVLNQIKLSEGRKKIQGTRKGGKSTNVEWSLYDFVMESRSRKDIAEAFDEVMQELSSQTSAPVLITLDDINIFTEKIYSENRNTGNHRIYHGDLQVIRNFLNYLSGTLSFKNGTVLAAVSGSHHINETILSGLGLQEPAPYAKINRYDPRLASKLQGVKPFEVKRYTTDETRTALKYYKSSKVIAKEEITEVTDDLVNKHYFLSGNGNPRELLTACTKNY